MRIRYLQRWLILTVLTGVPATRLPASSEALLALPISSQTDAVLGNVVDVTAGDFFFVAPESIPAGLTTFRLRQVGKFAHDLSILQLPKAKTFEEFVATVAADQPRPWWISLGGPGFIDPPLSTNASLLLEPGSYVLACFVTAQGDPAEHRRMFRPLQVVSAAGAISTEPRADLVVKILNDSFEFSPALSAGRHLLRIENAAAERRLFRIERVLPGRTVEEALTWGRQRLTVPETVRPTEPKGRLAGFEPGRHLLMAVDLDPGTYLVSSMPNRATSHVFVVR